MAQQSLRGLDRLSDLRKQCCVRVPERVPGNTRLFDPITRGRKHAVVEVFLVERRSARRAKHQVVRRSAARAAPMGFQKTTKESADGDDAVAAASFRRTKLAVRIRLGDLDRAAKQVHTFPAKSENLSDPQPGKHRKLNDGAARLR